MNVELVNFDEPMETREFERTVRGSTGPGRHTLGRATYEPAGAGRSTSPTAARPGARSSTSVSCSAGGRKDEGRDGVRDEDRRLLSYIPPGHDSWVVGDELYVSLHIMGSEDYATPSGD